MEKKIPYPYTLEKKDKMIKLEIKPGRISYLPFYVFVLILSISTLSLMFIVFTNANLLQRDYIIASCISVLPIGLILYVFYMLNWKIRGKEMFILYPDKLEYMVDIKPFKIEKYVYHFSEIEFYYDSDIDYYSEEEEEGLGIGLYSKYSKTKEAYPIRFIMDDGENIIDSEREIPIEVILKMRDEYLLLNRS
jgi:hypothetical protein